VKWRVRILWFAIGVAVAAGAAKGRQLWQDWSNPRVDVTVVNNSGTPVTVAIQGYGRFVGLGGIRCGGTTARTLDLDELGEGPALLRVATTSGDVDYPLGTLLSDNGPFERVVTLAPEGAFAYFYAGSKGAWCGPLQRDEPAPSAAAAPAPSPPVPDAQ
jgi:hypothetical protein